MMRRHGPIVEADGRGAVGERIVMPDADVRVYRAFFARGDADSLFGALQEGIAWKQDTIRVCGRARLVPRLTAWHGDRGATYGYSGIRVEAADWTPVLLEIKRAIETVAPAVFNSVLLNLYRDGSHGVSWHSDDEPELGDAPVIGSVSFGEARPFQMKHKTRRDERRDIMLEHGSCLIMRGGTQRCWLHQIPKSRRPMGARVNLTFRTVRAPGTEQPAGCK